MRILRPLEQQNRLNEIRTTLGNSGFKFTQENAKIISGIEEGVKNKSVFNFLANFFL